MRGANDVGEGVNHQVPGGKVNGETLIHVRLLRRARLRQKSCLQRAHGPYLSQVLI